MNKQELKYSKRIRHMSCLDIDLYVLSSWEDLTDLRAKVMYYNRHYKTFQGKTETVTIKESDYHKWTKID